jgi:hypothetical protein
VLAALTVYEPVLTELRQAARRPLVRFLIPYDEGNCAEVLMPFLSDLRKVVLVLRLRVAANLGAGQPQAALGDIWLMLRITDAIKSDPMLTSQLVGIACFRITSEAIREGLAYGQWCDRNWLHCRLG